MTIGSGRVLYQDLVKINIAIEEDKLKDNKYLKIVLKIQAIYILLDC